MSNRTKQSFISSLLFGSLFILVGAFIFLISIDVIQVPDEDFNAPRWAVAAVGMAFALAGAMAALNGLKSGYGDHLIFKWAYNAMLLMFMILFAVPFHWVAFGSGERSFSSSTSVGIGIVSVARRWRVKRPSGIWHWGNFDGCLHLIYSLSHHSGEKSIKGRVIDNEGLGSSFMVEMQSFATTQSC